MREHVTDADLTRRYSRQSGHVARRVVAGGGAERHSGYDVLEVRYE
jgi:hypothetical protein